MANSCNLILFKLKGWKSKYLFHYNVMYLHFNDNINYVNGTAIIN